jgi:hypothetical protein
MQQQQQPPPLPRAALITGSGSGPARTSSGGSAGASSRAGSQGGGANSAVASVGVPSSEPSVVSSDGPLGASAIVDDGEDYAALFVMSVSARAHASMTERNW